MGLEKKTTKNVEPVSEFEEQFIQSNLDTRNRPGNGNQSAKSLVLVKSMAVFAEKGIAQTTVQDLLDAAKISRRTFYKYFRNKVDVLESIYQLSIELLISKFKEEMSSAQHLGDVVGSCIDVYFNYHTELGAVIRMMQEEAMRSDSPLAPHRLAAQRAMIEIMDSELLRFQGTRLDPWVHYTLIWAMESASMHLLKDTPCGQSDVDRCKRVMRGMAAAVLVDNPNDRPPIPKASLDNTDPFFRDSLIPK